MEYRIYLRAEGRVSDCSQALLEFASHIDGHIPGMLRRRKHDGSPVDTGPVGVLDERRGPRNIGSA